MADSPLKKGGADQTPNPLTGQQFLQVLNVLFSTARIHLDNNQLLQDCAENFSELIDELLRVDDEINLLASVGCFYLQQEKVILQQNLSGLAGKLLRYFEKRQLDGLRFNRSTAYISHDEILSFVRILNRADQEEDPLYWLQSQLEDHNIQWVEIINTAQVQSLANIFMSSEEESPSSATGSGRTDESGQNRTGSPEKRQTIEASRGPDTNREKNRNTPGKKPVSARQRRRRRRTGKAVITYSYAMHSLHEVADRLNSNKAAGLGKSVQLVQNMVDMIINDDNVLLDLSTIRDYDDYTFTHSVNVSILSLCLGHRIGLSKVSLSRLGLSALFHDLGKIDIPKDILNKPTKLTDREFGIIKQHSINSVRRILKLRASYDRKASIILPPFEHHLRYDLSGYPKTPRKKPISLFGRIITIADVYDAITGPRVYRTSSMSPDRALGFMLKNAGKIFDPILLKVFINMLGIYPIGTVLEFENKEMGLVTQAPDETIAPDALWALLLKKNENGGFRKGAYLNLGTWNPDTGSFNRKIINTIHPAELGIQPAEFLL